MKTTLYYPLLGIAVAGSFAGCSSNAGKPKQPNIVVILADDIGYGDLSAYGATTVKRPMWNALRLRVSAL